MTATDNDNTPGRGALRLVAALRDWGTPRFEQTLKHTLEQLAPADLPLSRARNAGGLIEDTRLAVTVISTDAALQAIHVRLGIFFSELVGGCSCGDEPYSQPVYCQLQVSIDRQTAEASFELLDSP